MEIKYNSAAYLASEQNNHEKRSKANPVFGNSGIRISREGMYD